MVGFIINVASSLITPSLQTFVAPRNVWIIVMVAFLVAVAVFIWERYEFSRQADHTPTDAEQKPLIHIVPESHVSLLTSQDRIGHETQWKQLQALYNRV